MRLEEVKAILAARDISVAAADAQQIAAELSRHHGPDAWTFFSRQFLTPAHDFALHQWLFEQCYGPQALLSGTAPAWFPSAEIIEHANVTAAAISLGLTDFAAFYRWSITDRPAFWDLAIARLEVVFREPFARIVDAAAPEYPRWLPGARLNIVESCLQPDVPAPAMIESGDAGELHTFTRPQVRALAAKVANGLRARGLGKGDAVAMVSPMSAAAVATYLGIIAAGATVVSIADSFAADEIAARLRIAGAGLIVTQDFVPWGAKRLALYGKVAAAAGTIPVIVIGTESADLSLRLGDQRWQDFLSPDETFAPEICAPQDPINILFSSGTTAEPKAIPWDHTTPIKCAADAHFHQDLHPGDVVCWPTNLGWMMGPWLIFAALMNDATLALYTQVPHERAFGMFVQNARVTMLGLVPSLLRAWRDSHAMEALDWSAIKTFSSSGECSNPFDMLYLMHLAGYRPIIEYCGGTEIGGGYVTSTLVQPNIPATFSTPALGLDFILLDGGKSAPAPTGEVFLIGPSIGLSTRLLNRDHHAVYFADTPPNPRDSAIPLRRHGDELESLPNGYYRVAGRSDDTMNLGGIKVGCAEIERVVALLPEVRENAAVAVAPPGGGPSRLVLFVALRTGVTATPETLQPAAQKAIREQLNPFFRVEEIRIVPALPRTASNKILRRDLRSLISPIQHHANGGLGGPVFPGAV